MYKKIIIITVFIIFLFSSGVLAVTKKEGVENFPTQYQGYLKELQKKYPNWKFIALYIDLDWNYVINQENVFGKNLVPKSYSDSWKNTKPGEYNVEVDSGWVDCSRNAVEYCMDVRNFLNEVRIFQFENLSYDEQTNKVSAVEKILYGTEFYQKKINYYNSSGSLIQTNTNYSQAILNAAQTAKVSSYHLASRIKQEVGPFLSHSSISGRVTGFEGLYNFYNIGATSSSEPMGAIKNGLQYAKDGRGASDETKRKYLIPWDNKEKAITGGGIFIGSSYINIGQDTIYLQKFDVSDEKKNDLFWHQYMTNVLAPYSEGKLIYNGYKNSNLLESDISFIIPIYKNMPELPVQSPNIEKGDYVQDSSRVFADVTNVLNVRSGPSTSYETIIQISRNKKMTRIAKGKQNGERWDRVKLDNGIVGYVFQSYLKEVSDINVSEIQISAPTQRIKKGETLQLEVKVLPEEAIDKSISYSSSNENVAMIDNNGNILAISSGKTTITAMAKNGVKNQIEITVYTPVEKIEVTSKNIVIQEGKSLPISVIIYPEDADNKKVKFTSKDENIVSVDSNGNVTAKKQGETTIIVQSEENEKIQKEISIKVLPILQEGEIIFNSPLVVLNANIITGIPYKENTVSQIKSLIGTKYEMLIYDKDDNLMKEQDKIGTGCKIQFILEEELKAEYIFNLYGDVNGDGKINSTDLLVLQRHILEIEKLTGVFLKAGNIRKNGKNPTSVDSLLIQRHILELDIINQ